MSQIYAHELRDLIGLPWRNGGADTRGVTCWTLVVFAYQRLFGVTLPSYDEADPDDCRQVAALIESGKSAWCQVDEPSFGDVLLFSRELAGVPTHCAMALEPGMMLHIRKGQSSQVDWYDDSWRGRVWQPRFCGAFRHEDLHQ